MVILGSDKDKEVRSVEEYVEIMKRLNLPDPTLMDVAVAANLAYGRRRVAHV